MSQNTKKLQEELISLKAQQKQYQKILAARRTLGSQLHENSTVAEELDLVKDGQQVYKLIGPILVKQEITEARQNVKKRMDYISGEITRVEQNITDVEKKLEKQKDVVTKLQQQSFKSLSNKS